MKILIGLIIIFTILATYALMKTASDADDNSERIMEGKDE